MVDLTRRRGITTAKSSAEAARSAGPAAVGASQSPVYAGAREKRFPVPGNAARAALLPPLVARRCCINAGAPSQLAGTLLS